MHCRRILLVFSLALLVAAVTCQTTPHNFKVVDSFLLEATTLEDDSLEDLMFFVNSLKNATSSELLDDMNHGRLRTLFTSYPLSIPTQNGSTSDTFVTLPFAAAGVCVAYSLPSVYDVPVLSITDLRNYILFANSSHKEMNNATLVLPRESKMMYLVLGQLGISYADLAGAKHIRWESADRFESGVVSFSAEELVNTVRLTTLWGTHIDPVKCAAILADHPIYDTQVAVSPHMHQNSKVSVNADDWRQISVVNRDAALRATYPLISLTVVHVSVNAFCNATTEVIPLHYITRMLISERIEAALIRRGAATVTINEQVNFTATALQAHCGGLFSDFVVDVCGSSIFSEASGYLSRDHFSQISEDPTQSTGLIRHLAAGSGHGIQMIKDDTIPFTYTEIVSDEADIQYWPLAAFPISVIVSLPGAVDTSITLDVCTIPQIFFHDIQFWDDPVIRNANPFTTLPHRRIRVHVRESGSGTSKMFMNGLRAISARCGLGYSIDEGHIFIEQPNASYTFAPTTAKMISSIRATPYAIGFAFVPIPKMNAIDNHLIVAQLLNTELGTVSHPRAFDIGLTLAASQLSSNGAITLPIGSSDYPFVGITHIATRKSYHGNCTKKQHGLNFMRDLFDRATKDTLKFSDFSLIPVQPLLKNNVNFDFTSIHCDGEPMFHASLVTTNATSASPEEVALTTGGIVGIVLAVAIVSVILIVTVVKLRTLLNSMKSSAMAPDDPQNVTIMLVDIQNSMALWARIPGLMGTAFDIYATVVRSAISSHGAYEVKTIGDHFMIACQHSECAVKISLQIQHDMHHYPWVDLGEHIDAVYDQLELEGLNINGSGSHPTIENFGAGQGLFHGLRVRCGIASGPCTIISDNVGGIDYLGQTPNKAHRIQQLANGGQILCDRSIINASGPTVLNELPIIVKSHGLVHLREITERVPIEEIVLKAFRKRRFRGFCNDGLNSASQSQSGTVSPHMNSTTAQRSLLSPNLSSTDQVITGAISTKMESSKDCVDYLSIALSPLREHDRAKVVRLLGKSWRVDVEAAKRRAMVRVYNQRDAPGMKTKGAATDDEPQVVDPSLDTTTIYLAELSKLISRVVNTNNKLHRAAPKRSVTCNSATSVSATINPFMVSGSSGNAPGTEGLQFEGIILPHDGSEESEGGDPQGSKKGFSLQESISTETEL